MKDLEPDEIDDITIQRILNSLLDSKKNLELKTHIYNPKDLAGLYIFAEFLGEYEATDDCKPLLKKFIRVWLKYMVSKDREGRREIIRAVSSMYDSEMGRASISDKLTKNLK